MKIQTLIFSILFLVSCNQLTDYKESFQLAKYETDKGKYTEAIALLDKIIQSEPDFDSAYAERAYNYLLIEKPEQAIQDVNKAIEINFNNIDAYFIRGLIYGYLFEYDKALKDYTHIIRLGDSTYISVALRERANIYYATQEIEKSIKDLSEIIEMDSLNHEVYVSRGIARLRHDVYEKYADSVKISLSDSTLYSNFFRFFKIVYSSNDNKSIMYDTKGAISDFSKAIKINPDYSDAYYNKAKVYEDLGLEEEALVDINKAIQLDEKSDYYMTRALFYKTLKESEKSLNDFNKAIEINPNNGFAYINRGYLKKEQFNDNKGAEKDINMAEKLGIKTD